MRARVRLGVLPLVPLVVAIWGCRSAVEDPLARVRMGAVTAERYARVQPYLEALRPGDDFSLFAGARRVHWIERDGARWPVVVIPSWITSLSGGAAGGLSMFGQLIARGEGVIRGSHVFGYVREGEIVPRYQVLTEATLIDEAEYGELAAASARGIGMVPRRRGPIYFKDLFVAGARPLDFPDPADRTTSDGEGADAEGLDVFYSEERFRRVEPKLRALPRGTDLLGLLAVLEALFLTRDYGESHSLRAPGFLNYRDVRTQTFETETTLYKLRPFGFVDGGREVAKWIAVFANDRLQRVVPYRGEIDWSSYIVE